MSAEVVAFEVGPGFSPDTSEQQKLGFSPWGQLSNESR
jgi:hypothetical protein